jgi:transcriptional regulator with XRE-family HTH domain
MSKRKIIILSLLGALVSAAAFGAVAYGSARAAGISSSAAEDVADIQWHGGRGVEVASDEKLAEALGITVDELTAAREEAKTAALEQAVADDLLTQAQADAILSGDSTFLPRIRWSNWLSENGIDYQAYLAEALGITVEELQAARSAAFTSSINQAVADGSLTQEQADLILGRRALAQDSAFQSAMQTAFEAAVNQAVASGVITQAQADQLLANSSGIWMDGMGGRGHGHRGGDFEIPASPETSTTTP